MLLNLRNIRATDDWMYTTQNPSANIQLQVRRPTVPSEFTAHYRPEEYIEESSTKSNEGHIVVEVTRETEVDGSIAPDKTKEVRFFS